MMVIKWWSLNDGHCLDGEKYHRRAAEVKRPSIERSRNCGPEGSAELLCNTNFWKWKYLCCKAFQLRIKVDRRSHTGKWMPGWNFLCRFSVVEDEKPRLTRQSKLCKTLMGPLDTGQWTLHVTWCTDDALMMHWWYADDALMMRWWCADDALMMHWWCTNDALMMHWWCGLDAVWMQSGCGLDAVFECHIWYLWTLCFSKI